MRLKDLRDVHAGQEIDIVGRGPAAHVFPVELLAEVAANVPVGQGA